MATKTVQPDADPETSSVDGHAYQTGPGWSDLVNGAGTGAGSAGSTIIVHVQTSTVSGEWQHAYVGILVFDLGLPAGAVISSADLDLYVADSVLSLGGNHDLVVVSAAPASNTAVAAGDYDSLGSVAFARKTESEITVGAYNTFSLNSSGLTHVDNNKSGAVAFGLMVGALFDNVEPAWQSSRRIRWGVGSADGGSPAKLTVTYTVPGVDVQPQTLMAWARPVGGVGKIDLVGRGGLMSAWAAEQAADARIDLVVAPIVLGAGGETLAVLPAVDVTVRPSALAGAGDLVEAVATIGAVIVGQGVALGGGGELLQALATIVPPVAAQALALGGSAVLLPVYVSFGSGMYPSSIYTLDLSASVDDEGLSATVEVGS